MDFDALLTLHVGEWGRGQLLVLLAASAGWATLGIAVLSMVFVTQTPTWTCTSADDAFCQQQLQLKDRNSAICSLQATQYRWDNPGSSLVSTFGLVCDRSWLVGLANASFFIGYACGSGLFGWMADKHGRKFALLASALSTAVAMLCGALSSSYNGYVAARLLQGVCCSGLPIAAYVLSTESVGPSVRGTAGTGSQLLYHLGEWMLPVMALGLQDWRLLYVAVAACCVLTAVLAAMVPESPRWLLLHGREAQAFTILSWLAHCNGRQLPPAVAAQLTAAGAAGQNPVPKEASESKDTVSTASGVLMQSAAISADECDTEHQPDPACTALLSKDQSLQGSLQQHVLHKDHSQQQQQQQQQHQDGQHLQQCSVRQEVQGHQQRDSVWMIFTDPLLARLFWVSAWMCTVMAAAFFTTNLATEELQGSLYVNFIVTSIGELPATVIGALAVDSLGRCPTIATGLLVSGVACCICALLDPGAWSTAMASLGKACCSSSWSLAYIYAAELMPTSVRSAALASSNQAARLGGAVAPFIIYAGEQLGHPKLPFAVVGGLSAFTAVLTAFLPETRGKGQPDTMVDLHRMYGRASSSNSSGGSAGRPGFGRGHHHHSMVDAGEQLQCGSGLQEDEPGLLQRLLSQTASSGSWIAAAMRTRSSSSFSRASCQSGSVMLDGGASSSELVAIVSDDSQQGRP